MRILLPPYNGCCCLHAKTGLWVSVNPWGQNNTQFGLARWNAHRLWHLCLWMWTSPLQYWRQFKVNVLTPWLWIVSIHVIPFILNMCYIWSWPPWWYTLLLTFNTVDTVVYVKFACELVLKKKKKKNSLMLFWFTGAVELTLQHATLSLQSILLLNSGSWNSLTWRGGLVVWICYKYYVL